MICLVIPTLSLLLFIQSLYSISKLQGLGLGLGLEQQGSIRVRTAGKRLCKRMSQSSGDVLERNEFLTKAAARKRKQRESAAEDSEDAKRRRKDDKCQRKRAARLRETPQRRTRVWLVRLLCSKYCPLCCRSKRLQCMRERAAGRRGGETPEERYVDVHNT